MNAAPTATNYALLVIDTQDSFQVDRARWQSRSNPNFERNLKALIKTFEKQDQTLIYILHNDDDVGFRKTDKEARLASFLQPRASDALFVKNTRSAFTNTDLDAYLRERDINDLVITGIQTEQCCETTARHAADLGYRVIFVTEATRTFPIRHWQSGAELGVDAIVERTEYVLATRFAQIMSVSEVVQTLAAKPN